MDDHRPPHASRHHHHPHHRPARRRRSVFGWWLLLAFVGAGGLAWGVRSGFLERAVGGPRPASQARRLEALRELRAQESAAREQERETRLAGIRAAIAQQKERADQALRDYQAFLESGGTAVLTVRRETMDQARRKAQEEVAACEREVVAAQRLKRALSALKMQAMAYGSVAQEIPEDSEVAVSYKALKEAAAKLDALSGTYTEKHPAVIAQRKEMQTALGRFRAAVARALDQVQTSLPAQEAQLVELQTKAADAARAYEEVEGAYQVAKLREGELAHAREREADRLADLRRRAFDIQFGAASSPSNRPAARIKNG